MTDIRKITHPHAPEVELLAQFAAPIWRQHYAGIVSEAQIEYMLERFQSAAAIRRQLSDEGYVYYIAYDADIPAGYIGIVPEPEKNAIFLSKLYVERSHRGKGLSRSMTAHALGDHGDSIYQQLYLTCNKRNQNSLDIYKHLGFAITGAVVNDIGEGMVMDDYILTLKLER